MGVCYATLAGAREGLRAIVSSSPVTAPAARPPKAYRVRRYRTNAKTPARIIPLDRAFLDALARDGASPRAQVEAALDLAQWPWIAAVSFFLDALIAAPEQPVDQAELAAVLTRILHEARPR